MRLSSIKAVKTSGWCVVGVSLALVLTASRSSAQTGTVRSHTYAAESLGTLGGTQSSAFGINNRGWITGAANISADQNEHAFLWHEGAMFDLGTAGGPNGSAGFPFKNDLGLIAAFGQTSIADPLSENWNFYCTISGMLCDGTNLVQRGFVWVDGLKVFMPTLGGNNNTAIAANDRGQVAGLAETATVDPSCVAPQILDYEAVIWTPRDNRIQMLSPYAGDTVSAAIGINNQGTAVGTSGFCAPISPAAGIHAMLWQDGAAMFLGSLGGTTDNVAYAINDLGQVVGISGLPGNGTAHAFLWQGGAMTDLGTLPGDVFSVAFSINNHSQVVGQSCDANFICRAFLWQKGTMSDLNTLIPANSALYLLSANDLNDDAEIVGQAFDESTGAAPAFLAKPSSSKSAVEWTVRRNLYLPDRYRQRLRNNRLGGQF